MLQLPSQIGQVLFDRWPGSLIVLDRQGYLLLVNDRARETLSLSLSPSPQSGMCFPDLLRDQSRDAFLKAMDQTRQVPSLPLHFSTSATPPIAFTFSLIPVPSDAPVEVWLLLEAPSQEAARRQSADPLTGLPARDAIGQWFEALPRQLEPDQASLLWFVFADLDHLKAINDQSGHIAGDEALKRAAAALKDSVRQKDLLARYGGDEFVLAGLCGSVSQAEGIADRIVRGVRRLGEDEGLPLSLSAGLVIEQPGHARDISTLVQAADRALYQAKARGGDQFVLADATK